MNSLPRALWDLLANFPCSLPRAFPISFPSVISDLLPSEQDLHPRGSAAWSCLRETFDVIGTELLAQTVLQFLEVLGPLRHSSIL